MLASVHLIEAPDRDPVCLTEVPALTSVRKALVTLVAALLIGGAVAACSPGTGTSPEPTTPAENPTVMPSDSALPSELPSELPSATP
jgi:hypothetical protein